MSKKSTKRTRRAADTTAKVLTTVLVLRICAPDMTSTNHFKWPEKGPVECPDWQPTKECGAGLHGWLWGEGDHSVGRWTEGNKWLVVEVAAADIVDLNGKVKFPRGTVVYCGDQAGATGYIRERLPEEKRDAKIIGGTATAGYRGTATAGDRGTATAGYRGTATAGDLGTATAGDLGTATSGEGGSICFKFFDGSRWRVVIGAVGENGVEKGRPYHIESGKIVAGEHPEAKDARKYAAQISAMKPADRPC